MGMFDWVKCNYKLPGANKKVQEDNFQTKSLENSCHQYTISKDGVLYVDRLDFYGSGEFQGAKKDIFTGEVIFYTSTGSIKKETWWEYKAFFENGLLINVIPLVINGKKI
jgi:hypothetical protein